MAIDPATESQTEMLGRVLREKADLIGRLSFEIDRTIELERLIKAHLECFDAVHGHSDDEGLDDREASVNYLASALELAATVGMLGPYAVTAPDKDGNRFVIPHEPT